MTTAYLNGKFVDLAKARVSAMDRGFLFGDGVYEVFSVYDQQLFYPEQHFERLNHSLAAIQLNPPLTEQQYLRIFEKLIKKNKAINQAVYCQITRGAAAVRQLTFPEKITPTVFIYSYPISPPSLEQLTQGISVITLEDTRWQQCQTKATTLLANVLLREQASEQNADEAILLRSGFAQEGTASNLFIVRDNCLITPALSSHLLGGITRQIVLELTKQNAIDYREAAISEEDLLSADEIWLTGSTREISPVVELNQQCVGNGEAGPVWKKIQSLYQQHKQTYLQAKQVEK